MIRGFEIVDDMYREHPQSVIRLPERSTKGSAGYDFFAPTLIIIAPGEQVVIPTDIKAYMMEDEVLLFINRSSLGIRRQLILPNSVGVIDSDYYGNSKNDGNIMLCLKNESFKVQIIQPGEKIGQAIFMKYLLADDDNTEATRNGGIGSTGN